MIALYPAPRETGAALTRRSTEAMRVILHIGAHRCATTSFQQYLKMNGERLRSQGVECWGPARTRTGLFATLHPGPRAATGRDLQRRAMGRIRLACRDAALRGIGHLIISDENICGTMGDNLHRSSLYPAIGERLARYAAAFDGFLSDVILSVRGQEGYWSSVLAYRAGRGGPLPRHGHLKRLARDGRGWRDVVTDAACALGDVQLNVLPFERFAGQPEQQLAAITGLPAPLAHARHRRNAAPRLTDLRNHPDAQRLPQGEGRWNPFDTGLQQVLRRRYAEDMGWLAAGADGLARLTGNEIPKAGQHRLATDQTRGRQDDSQDRRLARTR